MQSSKRTSRRRFAGAVLLGTTAVAAGVATLRATGYSVPDDVKGRLRVLSPWQYVVMKAVGARIIAPAMTNVADFADGYLQDLAEADRGDLMNLLALIEHGAPLSVGHLRRFSELPAPAQDEVLRSVNESSLPLLRAGFEALKAIAFMAHYRLPEAWPALGYPGPIVPRSVP